jgi:hypothetical protein
VVLEIEVIGWIRLEKRPVLSTLMVIFPFIPACGAIVIVMNQPLSAAQARGGLSRAARLRRPGAGNDDHVTTVTLNASSAPGR